MIFKIVLLLILSHANAEELKLKTVLALSRHNIRTPRVKDLSNLSPKEWPKWNQEPAYLTEKGALVEGHLGEYFKQWLTKEKLLPEGCPNKDTVYIYSNTQQRTMETAKAFVESAFKSCNVTVHHLDTDEMDPLFNAVIHNATDEFKEMVLHEMEEKLNASQLTDAYIELARIIDLEESLICKEKGLCDFTKANNTIKYSVGTMLDIDGPLNLGNSVVDSFIMSYYDGKPQNEVAWGEITTSNQWELLTTISRENENVRFNLTTACKDIAGPLLKNMTNILLDNNSSRKFTLLVGHDSNLNPVVKAFNFQLFVLRNQYEPFPIGGKLVFEKWSDGVADFMKIEYIYLSWSQLRDDAVVNLEHPPQRVVLQLNGCKNENGFCPWNDFVQVLKDMDL